VVTLFESLEEIAMAIFPVTFRAFMPVGRTNRLAGLIALGALCVLLVHAALADPQPAARQVKLEIGVFSGGFNPAAADAFEAWVGRRSDYNVDFFSQTGFTGKDNIVDSANWLVSVWKKANRPDRNMLFSVPLATNQDRSLAHVAAGSYDEQYKKVAAAVARAYPKAIIRIGWEFNGDWYPWAAKGRTEDYIAAFRRVASIFKDASNQFTIDWCANLGPGQFPAEQAYPGDDVVDVIGVDAYDANWLKIADPVARWPKFRDQDHGLIWHAQFAAAHQKPMSYPEWASGKEAGDNPYFIQQMYLWITTNNVAYTSYWNSNSSFKGQLSNGQYPLAAAMYLQTFGSYKQTALPKPPRLTLP
jgi:hypothetical protein